MEKSTGNQALNSSSAKRRLPYVLMDVFTAKPLHGNQLAVFTDARGLSDDEIRHYENEYDIGHAVVAVNAPGREEEALAIMRANGAHK